MKSLQQASIPPQLAKTQLFNGKRNPARRFDVKVPDRFPYGVSVTIWADTGTELVKVRSVTMSARRYTQEVQAPVRRNSRPPEPQDVAMAGSGEKYRALPSRTPAPGSCTKACGSPLSGYPRRSVGQEWWSLGWSTAGQKGRQPERSS